jgi:adenylate kinase family enzyme
MNNYDFRTLNDKEFEVLCADLLGETLGVRIERFKPGRDGGVDGRFFASSNKEVILQCKHWANTRLSQLIKHLGDVELRKIERLKPTRYLLAVSHSLSRTDKKAIVTALGGVLIQESDVYGKEDLNDLLGKYTDVEKRHYKLWLGSAGVLSHILNRPIFERSSFSLDEALSNTKRYVVTSSHEKASHKLEELGVVILTGEPGVGKTTLAEHLALQYVSAGYEYFKLADGVTEAEAVIEPDKKQIFYFDDFLGRNYFEALNGKEGTRIVGFIRRICSERNCKRFILTSRSTVLNQGKILVDCFAHQNIDRNEFELTISDLTGMEKARILYSHLWHSDLPPEYVDELYRDKRYRNIISHKNYNPRLISFITDYSRQEGIQPENFWLNIEKTLANPTDIWDNPFVAQQDDFGRALVLLVTLNRKPIPEDVLASAFSRYLAYPENAGMKGHRDYLTNLRHLTGSLLTRRVLRDGHAELDLFNPSLGDYVLSRYARDLPTLKRALACLRSTSSVQTLLNICSNELIRVPDLVMVLRYILDEAESANFVEYASDYLSRVALGLIEHDATLTPASLRAVTEFVCREELPTDYGHAIRFISWSIKKHLVDKSVAELVIEAVCKIGIDGSDQQELRELIEYLDEEAADYQERLFRYQTAVVEYLSDNISEEVSEANLYSDVDYDDLDDAKRKVITLIEQLLGDYGAPVDGGAIDEVFRYIDCADELTRYHHNSWDSDDRDYRDTGYVPESDGIDDLFERG